jgi:hypothetical protein
MIIIMTLSAAEIASAFFGVWPRHFAKTKLCREEPFFVALKGGTVRLYEPYYEAQSCPSCDPPEEDCAHVFHCPAADRELWRTEFLKKLTTKKCTELSTDPALKSVMVTGLECILLYDTTVAVNAPPRLHALCSEQDSIG